MKIHYKNSVHVLNAVLIISWIAVFVWFKNFYESAWFAVFSLVAIVCFVCRFLYDLKFQYLHLKNGVLYKNTFWAKLFSKKIQLNKIEVIRRSDFGFYVLKTAQGQLKVNPGKVRKDSLKSLNQCLCGLGCYCDIEN